MPEPVPPELQAAGSPDRVRLTAQMPATETGTLTDMDLSDRLEIIADAKRLVKELRQGARADVQHMEMLLLREKATSFASQFSAAAQEYEKCMAMGFDTKQDYDNCVAMGFDTKQEYEKCVAMGFDTKQDYDNCVAMGFDTK